MRCLLVVLILCLMAWSAPSQSASIDRIDITAYGIFSGPPGVRNGMGTNGIEHRRSNGNKIVRITTTIPACLGVKFGFVYSVVGVPDGTPVIVGEVYRFPLSGLHKPGALSPILDSRFQRWLLPGTGGHGIWYAFDNRWELVPGDWTIEIREGSRLLASKRFAVVVPKKGECPSLSA